jgi:DNA-binding NtrC family response regulator
MFYKPIPMKIPGSRKTFIVDDDPFWTALLTQILSDLGYTDIVSFSNGTDCIDHLHLNPALIFLDYQMQGMDGLQVLQKIKNYNAETAVIFCTDQQGVQVVVSAMKNGSCDYLVKSASDENDLPSVVKQMLAPLVFSEKVF